MRNRKTKSIKLMLFTIVTVGIFGIAAAFAQQPAKEEAKTSEAEATKPKSEEIVEKKTAVTPEDYIAAGQNVGVESGKTVGDAAVAGANVRIAGKVEGYVMAAGANVIIDAPVGNDLWAAGATVIVNSSVKDNAMLAGSSVLLDKNGSIGNDVRIATGTAEIKGPVGGNLNIAAANAVISSKIGGDVEVYADTLTLGPGAVVSGNLVVHGPNQPTISPEAKVIGKTDFYETEGGQYSRSYTSAIGSWFGGLFMTFLWLTVLGLVAIWFSSVWTNRVAETLKSKIGKSFLVGLVAVLAAPLLLILLLITVIGLPLAGLLAGISIVALLLSGVFVAYLVGDLVTGQLNRWENSNVLKIILGSLAIAFVMSLPWIGGLAKLAVVFFGVGAFLLERKDLVHQLREQSLA